MNSQTPGERLFEVLAIHEAVADLFSSQLAGGGNRLTLVNGTYLGDQIGVGGPGPMGVPLGVGEVYCAPFDTVAAGAGLCFDVNLNGTETLADRRTDEANRLSTLFVDLIDDAAQPDMTVRQHGGVVWTAATTCTNGQGRCPIANPVGPLPGPTLGVNEERVAQPFSIIVAGIENWVRSGQVLQTAPFMRGMTRALDDAGVLPIDTCQVYALHTPGGMCETSWRHAL